MTATGKTRICTTCGATLTEIRHASGRTKWYTPGGAWHQIRTCNMREHLRQLPGGKPGRGSKWELYT